MSVTAVVAGYAIATGTGNIVLGSNQDTSVNTVNNELNIGGTLFGDLKFRTIGISTRAPQAALDVVSTGALVTQMAAGNYPVIQGNAAIG